jgi:hypothetical protein
MVLVAESASTGGVELLIERLNLAVPANIRQFPQWLVWRFEAAEKAGDKDRKVPYYVNGARRQGLQGSAEDRACLVKFDAALEALKSEKYSGVGVALLDGSPLNAIDFDNCVEQGVIAAEIRILVNESSSYAEVSPSGRGVRLLGFGDIASRKRIHPAGYNVEAFGASGFVTVTGNRITANDVEPWPLEVKRKLLLWLDNEDNAQQHTRSNHLNNVKGTDPVFQRLKTSGSVKREFHDGRVAIGCPFEAEHTSGSGDSDTIYFLPNTHGYAKGHFHCLHAHCAERTDGEFLAAIGYIEPIPGFLNGSDGPIVPADTFMDAWTPTEYLIKGVLQRGQLIALTGHSNAGKTAIALKMAVCVALGLPFGRHKCKQERVVYFAGENADDVRCRVIALCQDMKLEPAQLAPWLYVLSLAFPLATHAAGVKDELKKAGPFGLVIIDTRAAYATAVDENANMEALADARVVRDLMTLPGRPTAMVLNHPPHRAPQEELKPRGGSAYWGELDSNLTAWNDGSGNITLHWNKIRGAHWEPVTLTLRSFTLIGYVQPDGDSISSVVADITTDEESEALEATVASDEDALLVAIADDPEGSVRKWADDCGWKGSKNRVARLLKHLHQYGLIRPYRRRWNVTKAGETEVNRARFSGLKVPQKI